MKQLELLHTDQYFAEKDNTGNISIMYHKVREIIDFINGSSVLVPTSRKWYCIGCSLSCFVESGKPVQAPDFCLGKNGPYNWTNHKEVEHG